MIILKFGGTSVGSVQRIKNIAELINDKRKKIVVLSAMSGTTNELEKIACLIKENDILLAKESISKLANKYKGIINQLLNKKEYTIKATLYFKRIFELLYSLCENWSCTREKLILSQGEFMSTYLLFLYMSENNMKPVLISAFEFMRTDKDAEPDYFYIKENLERKLEGLKAYNTILTQGFICRDVNGEISNLKRGGSDYTAALLGAATNAEEIQIWTDIDGIHNNDPRYIKNTLPINYISFDEAAELAYFGAKILHPSSILPAKKLGIPVRLKNSLNPKDLGTLIMDKESIAKLEKESDPEGKHNREVIAIAAKDNITAIKICSTNMLLAYGFLSKVFEIFSKWKTPIDMITTSEVEISLTVDCTLNLKSIRNELEEFCSTKIDEDMCIICIVGNFGFKKTGIVSRTLDQLKNIPIRMISYGGNEHNLSLLVNQKDKKNVLEQVNELLIYPNNI